VPALFLLSACLSTAQNPQPPTFDGKRAFSHLKAIVSIGPRPAGSPGAAKTREYITRELGAIGLKIEEQAFEAATPLGVVRMVNLRTTVPGADQGRRLIVGGHYDTKLFRDVRFVGANDGASSTAFLIELARVLKLRPARLPVEILFFDGEEAVVEWQGDDRLYGSRHYVRAAAKDGSLKEIAALVLVDMIGERNPRFLRDEHSTPWLTDIIWRRAAALGRREFAEGTTAIEDDHLPFIEAGIPAVDIIDLDYAAWHTPEDTLDKVSADSLQAVGDVLLAALPDILSRLREQAR
jgi:Zn-dependent M28 family amino/carboxypeptidase